VSEIAGEQSGESIHIDLCMSRTGSVVLILLASSFLTCPSTSFSLASSLPRMSAAAGKQGPVSHVLFDMDGLLLDTERVYTVVTQRIVERYGKKFKWSLKSQMMGRRAPEAADILIKELGLEGKLSPEAYLEEREAAHDKMWPEVELMPGAERLVRHLHKHHIPFGVATSSHTGPYDAKTSRHKHVFSLFDTIVKGDDPDVKKGKPAPDIFLVCASRLPSPPSDMSRCLVFEDAILGVEAAKAAGMRSVLVPDPNMLGSIDVEAAGATQILPSLDKFVPEDWGMPPYDE